MFFFTLPWCLEKSSFRAEVTEWHDCLTVASFLTFALLQKQAFLLTSKILIKLSLQKNEQKKWIQVLLCLRMSLESTWFCSAVFLFSSPLSAVSLTELGKDALPDWTPRSLPSHDGVMLNPHMLLAAWLLSLKTKPCCQQSWWTEWQLSNKRGKVRSWLSYSLQSIGLSFVHDTSLTHWHRHTDRLTTDT